MEKRLVKPLPKLKVSLGSIIVVVTIVAFWIVIPLAIYVAYSFLHEIESMNPEDDSASEESSACNVVGINIHGDIVTYAGANSDVLSEPVETASEDIIATLDQVQVDETLKAVMLDVDSYGGYPLAGKEIADAIKSFTKPVVALIRQSGVSAAYWAVSSADVIFASPLSDVGGIGVTMSYLENAGFNTKEGYAYQQLSTGKYKDAGNPDKPLTSEERALFMRDLNTIHQAFVQEVAANRKMDVAVVQALADGSTLMGQAALQNRLIDKLGSYPEVEQYIKELIKEGVEYCW